MYKVPKEKIKEFNKEDYKSVDKFVKRLTTTMKVILVPSFIFSILLYLFVFISLILMFKSFTDEKSINIVKELERNYDKKFTIVSEELIDDSDNGLYKVSPKDNKDIVCNVVKYFGEVQEDYGKLSVKYFIDKWDNAEIKNAMTIEESIENDRFFNKYPIYTKYDIYIDIEDYSQIEEATRKLYEIKQYIEGNVGKYLVYPRLRINEYWSTVYYEKDYNVDQYIRYEKYEYIDYLKRENKDLSEIPIEEIENVYFPRSLKVIVNGKNISIDSPEGYENYTVAKYNAPEGVYRIDIRYILNNLDNVEIIDNKAGKMKGFRYNGIEYELVFSEDKAKRNKVYYNIKIDDLKQIFSGAEIEYDYQNSKLNINIL